jgi:peptide/nickel transport system substrate-binding protein
MSLEQQGSAAGYARDPTEKGRAPRKGKERETEMKKHIRAFAAAGGLLIAMSAPDAALAQKSGGILKMYVWDNPPSMSMLDGANPIGQRTTMGVFNNLIMFDQHVKQNSLQSIVPDLATGWSWNEEGTALTLPLRHGVKWHDGKPFTAKDVQCTWDLLLEKSSDKLRVNPLKSWYRNLEEVSTNGDYQVTFHLKRPQPAFPMLLANGFAPIYPCHLPARDMRQHPIGTGPFKFVEFKPNESIKVARNADYWKKDRPYLDGIEWTIIRNMSTATLAFRLAPVRRAAAVTEAAGAAAPSAAIASSSLRRWPPSTTPRSLRSSAESFDSASQSISLSRNAGR